MHLRLAVHTVSLTVCLLLSEALLFNEERSENAEPHQVHQHSGPSRSLQRVSEYRPPQNRGIYHGDSTSNEQINEQINSNAGEVGHSYHEDPNHGQVGSNPDDVGHSRHAKSPSHDQVYGKPADVGHSYHNKGPSHNQVYNPGEVGHSHSGDASDHSSKKGRSYYDHNHAADRPGSAQPPHGANREAHYYPAPPTGPAPGAGGRELEHQVKSIELLIRLASYLDVQGCFRRLVCESLFYGDRPTRRSDTETLVLRAFGLTPGSRDPGRWQTERFLLPAVAGWTARWGGQPDPCPSLAPSCSEPVVKRLRERAAAQGVAHSGGGVHTYSGGAHSRGGTYTSGATQGSGLH